MYIITSLPIEKAAQAWGMMFSYMHRWEAEEGFRFLKPEMALESPRLLALGQPNEVDGHCFTGL